MSEGKYRRVTDDSGRLDLMAGYLCLRIPVSHNMLSRMEPKSVWRIVRDDAIAAAREALQEAFLTEHGTTKYLGE